MTATPMDHRIRDEKFNELKSAIALRVAGRVEEYALKAIQLSLEEYHEGFKADLRAFEERLAKIRDENGVLRSLVGLTDTDVRLRILAQAEETKFLRDQLLAVNREQKKAAAENEQLAARNEQERQETVAVRKELEEEQKKHQENLDNIRIQLAEMEKRAREKRDEYDREKARINADLAQVERKTRETVDAEAQQIVKALGTKLRNLSGPVTGTASFLLDVAAKEKERPAAKQSRISEHLPDLDTIAKSTQELIRVLDTYLALFERPDVQYGRVNFKGLWDELGRKYLKYNQFIAWPSEKQYPPFITDQKLLSAACDALVRNAVESIPSKGSITVSGRFSSGSVELTVTDTGSGIAPEHRDRIFVPFYTAKPGHEGLGLTNAQHVVRALGGDIRYRPGDKDKGSIFTIQVPGAGDDKIQKP